MVALIYGASYVIMVYLETVEIVEKLATQQYHIIALTEFSVICLCAKVPCSA